MHQLDLKSKEQPTSALQQFQLQGHSGAAAAVTSHRQQRKATVLAAMNYAFSGVAVPYSRFWKQRVGKVLSYLLINH